jgi:superfamily II DNA or RNA helicase
MRSPILPTYIPQPSIRLRDYQQTAIEQIDRCFSQGHNRILVSGSPGVGKTALMSALARKAYNARQKTTILVPMNCVVTRSAINHTQMVGALDRMGMTGKYGVFSGAFPQLEDIHAPIQIVTLQTLASRDGLHQWLSDSEVVLIDEGHSGSFFKEAEDVYKEWGWKKIINFTATPFNRSQGVDERHGGLERNTAVVTLPHYRRMQQRGYLAPLIYHSLICPLQAKEKLDLDSDSAIEWMLQQWLTICQQQGIAPIHTVGFCKPKQNGSSQIDRVQTIASKLGIRFEVVSDETKPDEYEQRMTEYESGQCNLLCVQALSTGWDTPCTQSALLFRQIKSRDRYVQACGRVSRPCPESGKQAGHIFDFAGNLQLGDSGLHPKIEDLSESIDPSVLLPVRKNEGSAPTKRCIGCKKNILAMMIVCPHCQELQPRSSVLTVDPATGKFLTLGSDLLATQSREGAIAYFRQWRKIAYLNQWKPFASMVKCREIGVNVDLSDAEFWFGSIFECPDDPQLRERYRSELTSLGSLWGWDSVKVENEIKREFKQ